jgi:hypothetical protein
VSDTFVQLLRTRWGNEERDCPPIPNPW